MAAEEILNKLGLFDSGQAQGNIRGECFAALEYVTKGEVDAGIIFATEAWPEATR